VYQAVCFLCDASSGKFVLMVLMVSNVGGSNALLLFDFYHIKTLWGHIHSDHPPLHTHTHTHTHSYTHTHIESVYTMFLSVPG